MSSGEPSATSEPSITASSAGYQLYLDLLEAPRLLGVPVGEVANGLVALEDVLGTFVAELTECLAAARDAEQRHVIAQRLLARRLRDDHVAAPEMAYAVARLKATLGTVRVETLAREVGSSRRHLASRFREAVGLPPVRVAVSFRVLPSCSIWMV